MNKKIIFPAIFLIILIIVSVKPAPILASIISNRTDGTFLLENRPFFPIGFWPFGQSGYLASTDYQTLKISGFNMLFSDVKEAQNQGLKLIIPANNTDPDAILNTGKIFSSDLFAYYAIDEPLGSEDFTNHPEKIQKYFNLYKSIALKDPYHPIWTNHIGITGNESVLEEYKLKLIDWNRNTGSTITGTDWYNKGTWEAGFWTDYFQKVKKGYPEDGRGGLIMVLNGMEEFYAGRENTLKPTDKFTYEERLQTVFQAVVNGANGVMLYATCGGMYCDGSANDIWSGRNGHPLWTSSDGWSWYKQSDAFRQIKKAAEVLKTVTPGLTGTIQSGIYSEKASDRSIPYGKTLARIGTDGRLYIFVVNQSDTDQTGVQVKGIPQNYWGVFRELDTGVNYFHGSTYTVSNGTLGPFDNPYFGVRIFVQDKHSGNYHVIGNTIYDPSGNPVIFRGVVRDWFDFRTDVAPLSDEASQMQFWHVKVARVDLHQAYWLDKNSFPEYQQNVDRYVQSLRAKGISVILSLSRTDQWGLAVNSPNGDQECMLNANSLTFWTQVASKYKNDPDIFFDLYDSPHGISWDIWLNGGPTLPHCTINADGTYGSGFQAVGMQQAYDAIRATGATNLIFIAAGEYAGDLTGVPTHRVRGKDIVYAFHGYDHTDPAYFDQKAGFLTTTDAVVMTEFADFYCNANYYQKIINYAESRQIGWIGYAWAVVEPYGSPNCGNALLSDWDATPTATGQVVKDALIAASPSDDFSNGNEIDIQNYNQLVSDFGKTGTPGWIPSDINPDGKIDIFDYNIIVGNFGK